MALAGLLGEMTPAEFIEQYFLKLPFSRTGGCADLCELGGSEVLREVLASAEADVQVVRQGERWPEQRVPSFEEAAALHREGYTVLVRHAERHHPKLAALAAGFQREFAAPVDVHLYWTPPQTHGFGWHYDAEDVFILQTQGTKDYSLRKNTVNPWPLEETLPRDMKFEREVMPAFHCRLSAGDWLYIPNGYWHMARAEESSLSLAVGLMCPTALDVFDAIREGLPFDLLWRQRLPIVGEAAGLSSDELHARYRALFAQLAASLTETLENEAFREMFVKRTGEETSRRTASRDPD